MRPFFVPTVTRRGKRFRAQIRRLGHQPVSKTFRTKGEAWAWAESAERDVLDGIAGKPTKHTLRDALERYVREVAPTHKGERWERVRLTKLGRHPLATKRLSAITATDIAAWRDESLLSLKPASVRREMGLLGQVFDVARKEWRWISSDPTADVKKPTVARTLPRPVPQAAIAAMVDALGPAPKSRETALAFLLGIETAMRPTELFSLTTDQVDFEAQTIHLDRTKNGDERDVPLSTVASMLLLELLWMNDRKAFFTVAADSASSLWAEARKKTPYRTLHFRHARREGIRRMSKALDILELARAVGHRDLKSLMIYYTASAADMAKKLG